LNDGAQRRGAKDFMKDNNTDNDLKIRQTRERNWCYEQKEIQPSQKKLASISGFKVQRNKAFESKPLRKLRPW
jgi:hypothetical protein